MAAERTFLFRSDPKDGVARFMIQSVGLEFYADALPDFEGMPQHQVFCFGVHGCALPGRSDPRGSDFYPAVGAIDIHEAGAANRTAGTPFHGRKDDGIAAALLIEGFVD